MPLSRDTVKPIISSFVLVSFLGLTSLTSQVKADEYMSAPVPGGGNASIQKQNMPVTKPATSTNNNKSDYYKLPVSANEASLRLEELRNLMYSLPAHDFQERINDYLSWLSDLADAHWRLYLAFVKHDATKAKGESEKEAAFKLGQLKRQGQLLKAQFLVKQNRVPEALAPLVEIVQAEPTTQTGETAYQLLNEIGFSQDMGGIANIPETEPAPPAKVETQTAKPALPAQKTSAPPKSKSTATVQVQKKVSSFVANKRNMLSSNKLTGKSKR